MSHVGTGAKHIIYLTSAVPTYSIDYNQYYMGSSAGTNTFGFYGGTAAATFSDWKLLNSGAFDANGNYGDAVFAADFHTPQSGVGNNNGTNLLSIVPADINGVARTATPDRGAVEFVPLACLQPFNYAGTSTSSVINLSWSNVPGADSVHIEYGPSGFTQGTGLTMFADSTLTVTGLFANTCYDFYFTSYCGGTAGNGTGLFTFCTTCNLATLPYTEPFTTWPPACFTITGDNSWLWDHNLANGYAQARFWNYSVGTSTMQTKRVDVNTAAWVKFKWAHLYSSSYPDDRLIVRAKATTATTWDTIADLKGPAFSSPNSANTTPPASASDFIEEQIILDPAKFLNKEVDFQLIALTDFGPNLYIDEFVVEAVPACLPPFSINATGVTATATSINWSSVAGTCFNLEYGPQGFIQGTGQGTLINNATSPQAITGLTPNTWYDVYIADCCNSGVWAGPFSWKTNCLSQMNGAYTVGGTGTNNFPTLAAAITTLTGCGVSGPVTINLINGAHALPSTTFASILGVSATNTVTINGMGVANDTISFGAGTAVGLTFNGAQHIKFQNLTINATSVDRPVWLTGGTHHITFNNCHILGNATSTSGLSCVIAATGSATSLSGTGNNADRITISNCKLSGGYYGFTAYGTGTTDYDKGFVLTDNEFVDQYYYGIRMYYTDSVVVERNIVTGFRNTFAYGYYGFYNSNIVMKQNQFFAPTYGLYISQLNTANATTNSEMSNNFMGGGTYGAYITTYSKLNVYHNSFGGGTSGYYSFTPNGDVNIRNNIFGGISSYAFYSSTAPATGFTLNYNIYHSISGASIAYCATAQSTIAAWKTAQPAFNVNSLQGDPGFVSNTDYHILGTFPNGVGQNGLSAIDIDGDTRPAAGSTTVDIGADEFTPLNWDASLEALLVPLGGCGSATTMVQAVIKNFGMNTITSLPLTVSYSGGLTGTMNVTASVNIPQGATDTVTIGTFNTFAGATGVNFMGYASLVGDQKNSNDTLAKGPANYIPVEPVTHGMVDTVCPVGTVDLYAIGVPGTEYKWYDAAVGGNVVGTGDSITVPANGITTYYVAYDSTSVTPQVGTGTLVSTSTYITPYKTFYMDGRAQYLVLASELQALGIAGGGQINSLSFEVASPSAQLMTDFTIKVGGTSVSSMTAAFQPNTTMTTVYNAAYTTVSGWNVHTFTSPYIWNGSDNLIFEICYDNTAWTTNSSVYYTTTPFPSATDGYADLSASSGCTPGAITNQTGSANRPNMQINLRTIACSTTRKPVSFAVDPNAAVATFSHVVQSNGADVNFDATGSVGQTYAWDFGDGNTGTGLTTTHTYAAGGTYTACLIVTDLTCNSVDSLCQTGLATVGLDESLLN